MKPAPFTYNAPRTLAEALAIMDEHGYGAKLLAGGQSLIPVMNFRLAQPAMIVDLNGVSELSYLTAGSDNGIRIGAMVRHSQAEHSLTCANLAPLMSEVMPHIAHPQIRNRGTIGGSLAHADPASELPVIMVALQARFKLERKDSSRWVGAEDFYESLFTTALEPEEILTEIAVPPVLAHTGYAFKELARRHGDYAQAGVAAVITLDEHGICTRARLVFLNLGEIPMVADKAAAMMVGERPTPELIAAAAQTASQEEIAPTADIHASVAYKRHLAKVLGRRTLEEAVARAH
ncbi:MAG: xanthine dehydrogenase family protein subunit M [Candidatus Promineifilaceae bacterium]|nr:xanthine dehydrogenase family protein subunit M [Candidatus Promineifilaceae bacterium]